MKRELELLRTILLESESRLVGGVTLKTSDFNNADPEKVIYHQRLLIDEGYLLGHVPKGNSDFKLSSIDIVGISWKGHDFIAQIRDPDIWEKLSPHMQKYGIESVMTAIKSVVQQGVKTILFPTPSSL
jgi:hypothetical protein